LSLTALFGAAAAAVARRPRVVLAALTILAVASAFGLSGMKVQPVTDAFFDRSTEGFKATERAEATFGSDPVVVLARGDLRETLKAKNLESMSVLETCLAGDIRRGRGELFKSCKRLSELQPVQTLTGPATFLGRAVAGIGELYGEQIKRLENLPNTPEAQAERQQIILLATRIISRYGLIAPPSLDDPDFINRVVFGPEGVRSGPKPRLSYLFPNGDSAQVLLRLRADLTDAERREAIGLIRTVAEDEATRLSTGPYVVSGSPAVFEGLGDSIQIGVLILAAAALTLMSIALALVFGSTWRLLPLLMAFASVLIAAGLLRLLGGELSLAALGAAPILIGLSVDYAVQIQARYDEMEADADPAEAARIAARLGLPMIATACLATAFGFASLGLSGFPLVSEFGLLLGVGVLICLLVTFLFGFAALSIRGAGRAGEVRAGRLGVVRRARDWAESGMALAILAPSRLLLVSILIAACGWVVSTQGTPATEISQLLPSRNAAVQDLQKLEEATGSSGEIDLVVRARNVTDPAVVGWLDRVRTEVGERSGYQSGRKLSCEGADLCPGPSIPDFVADGGEGLTAGQIRDALSTLPPNERAAIIAGGLEGSEVPTETRIPFIVRSESVKGQADSIDLIREVVAGSDGGNGPPPGVTAELAGLPVVVTESVDALAASRYLLILAALLAVALVLLAIYRVPRRVIVPIVPIVVAGGWSSLTVASLDLPLNPLSAILSVMVIAIATEFSVILAARYYQERGGGMSPPAALRSAYGRTGMAIVASGITAIAGFAALVTSDVGILREFGLIAVLDLGVALLGVALVLPAVLAWMERR
jgi:hydrophobe/amphiphile efflux-3 (HAE3) family protein